MAWHDKAEPFAVGEPFVEAVAGASEETGPEAFVQTRVMAEGLIEFACGGGAGGRKGEGRVADQGAEGRKEPCVVVVLHGVEGLGDLAPAMAGLCDAALFDEDQREDGGRPSVESGLPFVDAGDGLFERRAGLVRPATVERGEGREGGRGGPHGAALEGSEGGCGFAELCLCLGVTAQIQEGLCGGDGGAGSVEEVALPVEGEACAEGVFEGPFELQIGGLDGGEQSVRAGLCDVEPVVARDAECLVSDGAGSVGVVEPELDGGRGSERIGGSEGGKAGCGSVEELGGLVQPAGGVEAARLFEVGLVAELGMIDERGGEQECLVDVARLAMESGSEQAARGVCCGVRGEQCERGPSRRLFGGIGEELQCLPAARLRELEPFQRGRDAVPGCAIERARCDGVACGEAVEIGHEGGRELGCKHLQVAERRGHGAGESEPREAPADEAQRHQRECDRFEGFAAQGAAVGELAEGCALG